MSQGKIRRATFWAMMFIAAAFTIGGFFYIYVDYLIQTEIRQIVRSMK